MKAKTKIILKYILGPVSVFSLYLIVVGCWASLTVIELLPDSMANSGELLLTKQQLEILLKIEDPTFYNHLGVDLSSGQGLTTITSSLARDIFLSDKKLEGVRGGFQSFYSAVFVCCKTFDFGRDVMALVLNKHLSKEKQLQLFISTVYMGQNNGRGVVGLSEAAVAYFDKSLSDLSKEEYIVLVAMLDAPNYYHPVKGAGQLKSRVSKIKSILSGACKPKGWLDTKYSHCNDNA